MENLSQFESWALAQVTVAKTDGSYPGQCVSLINQYLSRVLGISAGAWGNAVDYANGGNPIYQYFDKVSDSRAGDILIYGAPYGKGTDANGNVVYYGHIVIDLGNGQMLEQNGARQGKVGVRAIAPGYIARIRRKGTTTNNQGTNDVADDNYINNVYTGALMRPQQPWDTQNHVWRDPAAASWVGQPKDVVLQCVLESQERKDVEEIYAKGKTASGSTTPAPLTAAEVEAYIAAHLS